MTSLADRGVAADLDRPEGRALGPGVAWTTSATTRRRFAWLLAGVDSGVGIALLLQQAQRRGARGVDLSLVAHDAGLDRDATDQRLPAPLGERLVEALEAHRTDAHRLTFPHGDRRAARFPSSGRTRTSTSVTRASG